MTEKNFIVQVILGAEDYQKFIVRDAKTGQLIDVCEDSEELKQFF